MHILNTNVFVDNLQLKKYRLKNFDLWATLTYYINIYTYKSIVAAKHYYTKKNNNTNNTKVYIDIYKRG